MLVCPLWYHLLVQPKTAKSTARALYFFQSPPPPTISNDATQSSRRVSAPLPNVRGYFETALQTLPRTSHSNAWL